MSICIYPKDQCTVHVEARFYSISLIFLRYSSPNFSILRRLTLKKQDSKRGCRIEKNERCEMILRSFIPLKMS